MTKLGDIAQKVRSKNAGPFWLTLDIFCGTPDVFDVVCQRLHTVKVAEVLGADSQTLKRFDISQLCVIKISLPRPHIQGHIHDRDMHGASYAALLAELEI